MIFVFPKFFIFFLQRYDFTVAEVCELLEDEYIQKEAGSQRYVDNGRWSFSGLLFSSSLPLRSAKCWAAMFFNTYYCFLNRNIAVFPKKFHDPYHVLIVFLLLAEVLRASKREMSVATRGIFLHFVSFRHIFFRDGFPVALHRMRESCTHVDMWGNLIPLFDVVDVVDV